VIAFIRAWRAERKQVAEAHAFNEGYCYAAGLILQHQPDPNEVIRDLECEADNPFDRTSFDRGITEAIRQYREWL
jgi:hypothetical protein